MIDEETDTAKKCTIKDIISASFPQTSTNGAKELNPFFVQIFDSPTLTISFLKQTYFYNTKVFSLTKIVDTSPVYEWHYKGSEIKSDADTFANYSEYRFTTSQAMSYDAYFHPRHAVA